MGRVPRPGENIKISWFPAIHDRNGSISCLLKWKDLSLIFSGDLKPNNSMVRALVGTAKPIDLLIHEMVLPADVWAAAANGWTVGKPVVQTAGAAQENAHTSELALGHILRQAEMAEDRHQLIVSTRIRRENRPFPGKPGRGGSAHVSGAAPAGGPAAGAPFQPP